MKNLFLIGLFVLGFSTMVKAAGDNDHSGHDHEKKGKPHSDKEAKGHSDHDHKKEEKPHSDHDHEKEAKGHSDHGNEEKKEGEKNVGPKKGVTSFDEVKGFTLSNEAIKNFSIKTEALEGNGPWVIPATALLLTGEEKNIYRLRDGYFKRIDIEVVEKVASKILFKSLEVKSGDSLVVQGVDFIRTAEVDATSGESGHSH